MTLSQKGLLSRYNNEMSEEQIQLNMQRYIQGDNEAFARLYEEFHPHVYAYLRKRMSRREEVDECFQLVWLKFHRSKEKYNPQYPLLAWLFVISKTTLIDYIRTKKPALSAQGFEFDQDETEIVLPSMENLTRDQEQAISLRYLSEESFEQIAVKLKTSPGNIRQLISRGLKILRKDHV